MTSLADYRSLFDLSGKTAVVIGAGSGIGRATTLRFSADGFTVIACGRRAQCRYAGNFLGLWGKYLIQPMG